MSHTKCPVTSTFVGTIMLLFLLLALISCETRTTSGDSTPETKREVTTLTTLPEETTAIASSQDGIFFPQQRADRDYMMALTRGRLILDDRGCIRVSSRRYGDNLLIWPASFSLRVEGDDISIFDQRDRLVGRVGEKVELGGGEVPQNSIDKTTLLKDGQTYSDIFKRCPGPGPYWFVAES